MKLIYFITANCIITLCYAKLIYRTTNKPNSKLIADVKADIITKNRNGPYFNYYNKRATRATEEKKVIINVTNTNNKVVKDKVLVKKPIPKYHEVNSDEDYTSKYRWPQSQDSAEHEDEDFNINDYEFDVNHDEFASGRKPLEPRSKINIKRPRQNKQRGNIKLDKAAKSKLPRSLKQRKVVFPKKPVAKVTRNVADKMKEEDYDQEFSTSTQSVEETTREKDDGDDSDEFEDSKEFAGPASVRTVRSPWDLGLGHYVEKLGERTVDMMSKILSHLPIFPQVPNMKKIDDETFSLGEQVNNPMKGR